MTSGAITAEQVAEAERIADKAQRGRKVWIFVTIVTLLISMGLNIAHPFVYQPEPDPDVAVDLSGFGLVLMGLLSGFLPVLMMATMSHAIFNEAPGPVKFIVVMIFLIGMGMSLSAQYEMLLPAVGDVRAAGTVAVIDIPALTALFMIERGNRLRKAAERQSAALQESRRRAAKRAADERLAAEQRAAEQAAEDERRAQQRAADERLAAEQRAAAEAAERAAEAERAAAAERAEAERAAAERAENERLAEAERAERERLAAERAEAERLAAEETARAERERRERLAAAERLAAQQREAERERLEREQAEREAEEARKAAEREARAAARAERQARAELQERGDLSPEQKRQTAREMYLADPSVTSTKVMEAVIAKGGQWSSAQARKALAAIREEESGGLAEVRELRKTAAV